MELKKYLKLKNKRILHEGITNKSYLLDNKFVYRVAKNNFDPFNKNELEEESIAYLKATNLSEHNVFYDKNTGEKLSLFIPYTRRLNNPPSKKQLILVADSINKMHKLPLLDGDFKPFERLSFYKANINEEYQIKDENSIITKASYLYKKYPLCFSHNDLVKGNLLFKKNKLYILDFEYAGNNIAIFDIASFISENNINDNQLIDYFLSFFPNVNKKDLNIMIQFENLLWFYWAKFQYQRTKREIFNLIAKEKLSNI